MQSTKYLSALSWSLLGPMMDSHPRKECSVKLLVFSPGIRLKPPSSTGASRRNARGARGQRQRSAAAASNSGKSSEECELFPLLVLLFASSATFTRKTKTWNTTNESSGLRAWRHVCSSILSCLLSLGSLLLPKSLYIIHALSNFYEP